jgi:hypothetical protein
LGWTKEFIALNPIRMFESNLFDKSEFPAGMKIKPKEDKSLKAGNGKKEETKELSPNSGIGV